jgi:hypothetical protein
MYLLLKVPRCTKPENFKGLDEEQEVMVAKALAYKQSLEEEGSETILEQRVTIRL